MDRMPDFYLYFEITFICDYSRSYSYKIFFSLKISLIVTNESGLITFCPKLSRPLNNYFWNSYNPNKCFCCYRTESLSDSFSLKRAGIVEHMFIKAM